MPAEHVVYLGLGSSAGERRAYLVEAMRSLRAHVAIDRLSSVYETEVDAGGDRVRTLSLAIEGRTSLPAVDLFAFLGEIEQRAGRSRGAQRPIELDILLYDREVIRANGLRVPLPRLGEQPSALVPLAEIAPDVIEPVSGRSIAELRAALRDPIGVVRVERGLAVRLERDLQDEPPPSLIRLERAGVRDMRRVIRLRGRGPHAAAHEDTLFSATLDLFVELPGDQRGAHMSRFSDTVEEVLDEIGRREHPVIESLAADIAHQLLTGQRARRVDVELRAQFPLARHAPVSGKSTQELYTLFGLAAATPHGHVELVGVEAEGMMACPCAQDMVRAHARERLLEEGLDPSLADRVLGLVPLATHNQRGRGRLLVGGGGSIRAEELVEIVEMSMSSENYDLLKRPDELFVVEKAHRHPRFVEDAVREMLGQVVERYPELSDDVYVHARQLNLETIHKHDVFAERGSTLGELRAELLGGEPAAITSLAAWQAARLGVGQHRPA